MSEWETQLGRCCACDSAFADIYIKEVLDKRLPCDCGRCLPMPDTPAYRSNRHLLSRWQRLKWECFPREPFPRRVLYRFDHAPPDLLP